MPRMDSGDRLIVVSFSSAPDLYMYVFVSTAGTATMVGYYVGEDGAQVSPYKTYSITTANTLTALNGGSLPQGAVGFKYRLDVPVLQGASGLRDGTHTQDPVLGPVLPATTYGTLGRA